MKKIILILMVCLLPFAVDGQVKSSKNTRKHKARQEKTVKKSRSSKKTDKVKVTELTIIEDNSTPVYPRQYDSDMQKGTEDRTVTRTLKEDMSVKPNEKPKVVTDEIFRSVEQMPQFPGGDAALMKFLSSHINYPPTAAEHDIQGKVVVQFVVKKDGSIGEVKVVRSVDPELDAEAIRVCKLLPKFTPGRQNGQPVNVLYTLPMTFRLDNESEYFYNLLSKAVSGVQKSLPFNAGNGLTLTSIDIVENKVIYIFDNDESILNAELLKGMRDHSTDTYGQMQLASYMLKAEDEVSRSIIKLIALNEMGIQYYLRNQKQKNLSALEIYPQTVKSFVEENY